MKAALEKLLGVRINKSERRRDIDLNFPEGELGFPVTVAATAPGLIAKEWVNENQAYFDSILTKFGAILFRGFEIDTVERFESFMAGFGAPLLAYTNRSSPRFEVAKNVYHSTTYPADQVINMHSENSYANTWGGHIAFCCIEPPQQGGETPIADNRLVLRNLPTALREKFKQKGVRYTRNISPVIGLPWQEVFQTQDRKIVEEECLSSGTQFDWGDDDHLKLSWTTPAVREHPNSGQAIWFNHAFFFHKYALPEDTLMSFESDQDLAFNTYFGDGTEISKEEIDAIRKSYQDATVIFPWKRGDVLYLDNMLMSHGRMPFTGDRKIVVSLV